MANKRKKKYSKTYIDLCNKNICVEDLVRAVNQSDKHFGVNLKDPEVWTEPSQYIDVISAKADMNMAALICSINGIPISDYFETDNETGYGTICKPVSVKHPLFTYSSILDWENKSDVYNTDSLIFRCRYLTLVISQLMGKIDDVTEREVYNKYKYRHSKDEKRIILTRDIMNDIIRFILLMINIDSSYQNIILKIHEHLSYTKKNLKHRELRNLLNGHVINTRNGMKENMISERFMDDDLAIYNILKIAYMLSTNKTNVKVIPKFKYIEGATVKHDLLKLIEELGFQIVYGSNNKKFSPMFKAFIESRPSVWTQFYEESEKNYAVKIGLLSLAYAKFVLDDYSIDKFIDNMMKKGI